MSQFYNDKITLPRVRGFCLLICDGGGWIMQKNLNAFVDKEVIFEPTGAGLLDGLVLSLIHI